MDFNFSEEQEAIRALADEVFTSKATIERTKEIELSAERVDRELWRELASTGLLGIALPEEFGGGGLGLSELYALLEQQGRHVAAVPIWETTLAALAVNEFGSDSLRAELLPGVADGSRFLTVGLEEFGPYTGGDPLTTAEQDADGNWTLTGEKAVVPMTHVANLALVSATASTGTALLLVDLSAEGVTLEQTQSTSWEIRANVTFAGAPAQLIGAADGTTVPWLIDRVQLALAAIQWGVGSGAVAQAVTYLNGRKQFGRPLATFQAVNHQLADCYIDSRSDARDTVAGRLAHLRGTGSRHLGTGRQVVGYRRRTARRASHHACSRRHGRRHRLPGSPSPVVGQADCCHPRWFQLRSGASGCAARIRCGGARMTVLAGRSYADVVVGEALPELAIPLTRTLIVATAIATRDFQDVHHDPSLAQERGSKDVFMNILTSNGLVGRYVTDWAGSASTLRRIAIRLGAPNYPGDTMTMTGEVVSKEDGVVVVKVQGANSLGNHASGTVAVAFKEEERP